MSETVSIAEKAYKKDSESVGMKTGLSDFDKKIGGLHNSDLIIIAGRPSMGKTAFATNIAYNITKRKQKSKEDDPKECLFFTGNVFRTTCNKDSSWVSNIPSERIRPGIYQKMISKRCQF